MTRSPGLNVAVSDLVIGRGLTSRLPPMGLPVMNLVAPLSLGELVQRPHGVLTTTGWGRGCGSG